jgi:putative ABC transport system substrate-binding protein
VPLTGATDSRLIQPVRLVYPARGSRLMDLSMHFHQWKRREFITLLGSAAAWPLAANAQQPHRVPRIGVLLLGTPTSFAARTRAFVEGLRDLGYVEGRTVAIEWKWGEDRTDRLPDLAAELVRAQVDVIVTAGTPPARTLKNATRTIPIVMAIVGDPVAAGLVDSLARPGGNATGFSIVATDLSGRRLQLLKEIVPGLSSVAVMSNLANPQSQMELRETENAARKLDLRLHSASISPDTSIENAFEKLKNERAQALIVVTDAILYSRRSHILDLAAGNRLPAMYPYRELPEAGGLMSYAPSDRDLFRRAASYVDRILKGANAGDLPIEQPTKFELLINLKTAKSLGLDVPLGVLATADEVIE